MWKGREKGRERSPEGVPKINKIDEKDDVWKRSKNYEKDLQGLEGPRRTNRGKNIIRATQPTNQPTDYLNGRSNSFHFLVDSFVEHVRKRLKGC